MMVVVVVVVVEIAGRRGRRSGVASPGRRPGWTGCWTGLAGCMAGRPDSGPDRPVCSPVDRCSTGSRDFSLLFFTKTKPNRPNRRETMELEAKSWGNSRSSTTTPDPRTKTTQNATKSQIGQEAIWGYFWDFFLENFLGTKSGGWEVKSAVTKSC